MERPPAADGAVPLGGKQGDGVAMLQVGGNELKRGQGYDGLDWVSALAALTRPCQAAKVQADVAGLDDNRGGNG
jgi:hypothetical protein